MSFFLTLVSTLPPTTSLPSKRPPWGIEVHWAAQTFDVRNVDVSTSSFYYDGVLSVAWRDDSLCHGPFPPGYLEGTFPYGLGRPYVDGDTYVVGDTDRVSNYSWPFGVPGPYVSVVASQALAPSTSDSSISFFVRSGPPAFVEGNKDMNSSVQGNVNINMNTSVEGNMNNSLSFPCYVVGGLATSGTYGTRVSMRDFPSDVQTVSVHYADGAHDARDMFFGSGVATWSDSRRGVKGFDIESSASVGVTTVYSAPHSQLSLAFAVRRHPSAYVIMFVLPLILKQLMMIGSTFKPIDLDTRSAAPFQTFFQILFILFYLSFTIPVFVYNTRMDLYVIFCMGYAFAHHIVAMFVFARYWRMKGVGGRIRRVKEKKGRAQTRHDEGRMILLARVSVNVLTRIPANVWFVIVDVVVLVVAPVLIFVR